MKTLKLAVPLLVALTFGAAPAIAAPILGANLASFAVLGALGVTNVATSTIGGNLGSAPNASVGGGYIFTSGSLQQNTAIAQAAQLELDAAIVMLAAFGPGTTVVNGDLIAFQTSLPGGFIPPGIYTVPPASFNIPAGGNLVLDGEGRADALWVFQFSSTFITATTANVLLQNIGSGAHAGVYWNVASAATLNGPTLVGNVLAHGISSSDGSLTITCGRLLSSENQVTLIHDKISIGCEDQFATSGGLDQGTSIGSGGTGGSNGLSVNGVPEPGSLALLGLGLTGLLLRRRVATQALA